MTWQKNLEMCLHKIPLTLKCITSTKFFWNKLSCSWWGITINVFLRKSRQFYRSPIRSTVGNKLSIIIINNWILPGLICPTELCRPDTAQGLPTHWQGTRVWTRVCGWSAPYAIEGRNFHGPQRDCLTFPHSVYSAHLFLTEFFSLTRCTGFADSPPVDYVLPKLSIIMGNCRHRLDFASWSVWPDSQLYGDEFFISLNSAIFCILQGQLLSNSPSDKLSTVSSYIEFASCQLLGFSTFHTRWRQK